MSYAYERMIFATKYNNIKEAIVGGFADPDIVNEKIDEIVGELKEICLEQPEDGDPGEFFDNFTIYDEIAEFEKLRMKKKKGGV